MFEFGNALDLAKSALQKLDPVFSNFILSVNPGRVTLSGIGESCQITIPINGFGFENLGAGVYLVPPSILGVSNLGYKLEAKSSNAIVFSSGESSHEFAISPYGEPIPTGIGGSQVNLNVPAVPLSDALDMIVACKAFGDRAKNLCGVNFSFESRTPTGIRLTATDGVALATEVVSCVASSAVETLPRSFALPSSSIRVVQSILKSCDGDLTISVSSGDPVSVVRILFEGVEMVLSVLPGRDDFPSIIPGIDSNPSVFFVGSDFLGKLDRLSEIDIIDLQFSEDSLRILGRSSNWSAVESMTVEQTAGTADDDHDVAIVSSRLKSLVKSMPSADFFIRLKKDTSPIILTPKESNTPESYLDSLRLIMPVQRR